MSFLTNLELQTQKKSEEKNTIIFHIFSQSSKTILNYQKQNKCREKDEFRENNGVSTVWNHLSTCKRKKKQDKNRKLNTKRLLLGNHPQNNYITFSIRAFPSKFEIHLGNLLFPFRIFGGKYFILFPPSGTLLERVWEDGMAVK